MPLGGKDGDEVVAALDRNRRYLRGEIAHRVNLKFAPDIRFRIDERFDEAERIAKLLQTPEVRRDLGDGGKDSKEPSPTTPAPPPTWRPRRGSESSSNTGATSATCTAGSCST